VVLLSVREWIFMIARKKISELHESTPVWLPDYAIAESRPANFTAVIALGFALIKELSGEAHLERAQQAQLCVCPEHESETAVASAKTAEKIYVETTEQRFTGIRRCC
jgi:hypothetical protein